MSYESLQRLARERGLGERLTWCKEITSTKLNTSTKMVGHVIANHWNNDGTGAFPSIERIADKASVSRTTAKNAVKALTGAGWLTVKRGGGRHHGHRSGDKFLGAANEYTARLPRRYRSNSGTGYRSTDDRSEAYRSTGVVNRSNELGNRSTEASDTGSEADPQDVDLRFPSLGFPLQEAPDGASREEQPSKTDPIAAPPETAEDIEERRRVARAAKARLVDGITAEGGA